MKSKFLAGMYRSGSQWLYYTFQDAFPELRVFHEAPLDIILGWDGLFVGFTALKWALPCNIHYGRQPTVLIVRDPREVARSAEAYGYKRRDLAIKHWYHLNKTLKESGVPWYKIEDLWITPELLKDVAQDLEIDQPERILDIEYGPIGQLNAPKPDPPELDAQTNELAEYFGY